MDGILHRVTRLTLLKTLLNFSYMRSYIESPVTPLGPFLRRLRTHKNLSLKELSEILGTSESAIHRYESGWDRFELRTLRRLARALDADLEIRLTPRQAVESSPDPGDLAARFAPLFWDVDLVAQHLLDNPQWVLRRVLEYGDLQQNRLARRYFGDEAVAEAARHRSLNPRVRRFWEVVLQQGKVGA